MTTPDELEQQHTLSTATTRYDELRMRDALAAMTDETASPALTREESLELLALSEVVIRKAGYGRQLTVRTARATGASWSQIHCGAAATPGVNCSTCGRADRQRPYVATGVGSCRGCGQAPLTAVTPALVPM